MKKVSVLSRRFHDEEQFSLIIFGIALLLITSRAYSLVIKIL